MNRNLLKKLCATSLAILLAFPLIAPSNLAHAEATDSSKTQANSTKSNSIPDKILVGYWHNFDNNTGVIRLRDVSPAWDVINLSFGEPTSVTSGDIKFAPFNATDEEFIEDVKYLQGQGKKVLLSIGGQNGQVQLKTTAARDVFISSVTGIIDKYGLDGLDIDFEGHSLYFDAGDKDFKNPTTSVIVNLIYALKHITTKYGDDFVLTMAPETFFVQMGHTFYGGLNSLVDSRCGSYLPVIYAMRDQLDWLQVQYYNSGSINDNNGKAQNMGSAEFYASLAHMLLTGFNINNDPNNFFPALRPDQVVLGVPACNGAGNGWVAHAEVQKAFDALLKGGTVGGYTIKEGFPELRGLMSWSVNWDSFTKFSWTTYFRNYIDKIAPPTNTLKAASLSSSKVKDGRFTLAAQIPKRNSATSYKIFEGSTEILNGSLVADQSSPITITKDITKLTSNTFDYTIVLYDTSNNSIASNKVTVDTTPIPNTAPAINGVTSKSISRGTNINLLSGVTAIDKEDGDLTKNIVISGDVKIGVIGTYEVTYTVTDNDGLSTSAKAVITVVEKEGVGKDTFIASQIYTGGQIVIYNGVRYKAKWWTQYAIPGTNDVWERLDGNDAIVDILDLTTVANKYNTKKGDIGYEAKYDKNNDSIIDIYDLVIVAKTM